MSTATMPRREAVVPESWIVQTRAGLGAWPASGVTSGAAVRSAAAIESIRPRRKLPIVPSINWTVAPRGHTRQTRGSKLRQSDDPCLAQMTHSLTHSPQQPRPKNLQSMDSSAEPVFASGLSPTSPTPALSVFGPRAGYTPHISILVSRLDWMRQVVLRRVQGLSREELDWLPTPDGNTIGALLLHLAASETYYHFHTFDGLPWPTTSPETRKRFDPP